MNQTTFVLIFHADCRSQNFCFITKPQRLSVKDNDHFYQERLTLKIMDYTLFCSQPIVLKNLRNCDNSSDCCHITMKDLSQESQKIHQIYTHKLKEPKEMKQYPFPRQKAQLHYAVEYTSEFRANND